MKEFFGVFWKFGAIATVMFLGATICYLRAYQDPVVVERQVGQVVEQLDDLYRQHPTDSNEKRREVLEILVHEENREFSRVMWEHLAEALLLAGFMIVTVEGLTRYLASKEVVEANTLVTGQFRTQTDELKQTFEGQTAELKRKFETQTAELAQKFESQTAELKQQTDLVSSNVWNAIFNRLVPEEIGTEIKRILKSDVCRLRPSYTVVLSNQDYTDVPDGHVVVRRMMFYKLLNLTGGEVTYPINFRTLNTTVGDTVLTAQDGTKVTLPRIRTVRINRNPETLPTGQVTEYTCSVSLPKMSDRAQAWEVYSEVEGLSLTTDRALYILGAPCEGLEVQVMNHVPELLTVQDEDVCLTNGRDRLSPTTPQKWVCEGGILTGTALSVPWRAVL